MKWSTTGRYRSLLSLFLLLLIYDGAVRKWLLPGAEQVVFIVKDVLLVGAMGLWLLARKGRSLARLPPGVRLCLVLYAFWVGLDALNPSLPNHLVALWGLKSHLLYLSLIVLLPLAFERIDDCLNVIEKVFPWLVIPVCGLAFAQVLAPPDSFLNQQVRDSASAIAYFGEANLVRVTGTFSYISGMSSFVQSTCLLGIAMYLGGARSRPFLIGLGFSMAALPATGSRAVVAVVIVSVAILLTGAFIARSIGLRTLLRFVVGVALLTAVSLYSQDDVWQAFQQRVEGSRADESRTITAFTNAFDFMDVAGITGFGTGAANLGAVALANDVPAFSWLPVSNQFEEESGRIVLELGIAGWVFSLAFRVGLLIWALALMFQGSSRAVRMAGVLALPVMAMGVHQGNGVFAAPMGAVFYWFCVGVMVIARRDESQSRLERVRRNEKASRQERAAIGVVV